MDISNEIRFFALENAIKFNGKANQGAVIGKILALHPEVKNDMKNVSKIIQEIIKEVNSMSLSEQKKEFQKIEKIEKPEKKKQEGLPELPNAEPGKVITRIPPEPSKYSHLGHALSFLINYTYAKKYNGKCLLKFEDTNPEKCTKEYADAMEDDILNYLEIKPSKIIYISDDMPYMIKTAEKMIKEDKAYVCFCEREKMQDLRHKGKECSCRKKSLEKNIIEWEGMKSGKYKEGEAILRLKGDMQALNHVMRDPVLWRICYAEHFRHGKKYCVWPLYDFENSVEDCKYNVTHILRSSEFGTMRTELQDYIKDIIGCKKQTVVQYGRFNIKGATTKGREIREAIKEGKVSGWDDPSLVTLKALKRRGILQETLVELMNQIKMSSNTGKNIDWSMISSINRSILDPKVNKYFFIENPILIKVKGAPNLKIKINLHPDFPERGNRVFETSSDFFVSKNDYDNLKDGSLIRLMDCLNFSFGKEITYHSKTVEEYKKQGKMIIQWLPKSNNLVETEIRMPDNKIRKGLAEPSIKNLKLGDIVQFQRFGFCRLDHIQKEKYIFWFTNN
jgi:glutamyl-tRNA synthetase